MRMRPVWLIISYFCVFQYDSGRRLHLKICGVTGAHRAVIGIFAYQRTHKVGRSKSRAQDESSEACTLVDGLI